MTKGNQERQESASGATARTGRQTTPEPRPGNGQQAPGAQQQPRVISNPEDVASLVLMQIDMVNARKDELTIAIKGLSDLTRQLVRAYGENTQTIQQLQRKVSKLEGKKGSGSASDSSASSKRK